VRICRDCRHCLPAYDFAARTFGLSRNSWRQSVEFAKCAHPSALREHTEDQARDWMVTGIPSARPVTSQSHCSSERSYSGAEHCGPEGRFWEWRDTTVALRDPVARRALLRAILFVWGWVLASVSLGLGGGMLLGWAMAL
jgi:hypothetical protein